MKCVIAFVLAAAIAAVPSTGPSLKDHKKKQAGMEKMKKDKADKEAKMAAVNKVIKMLGDLQVQVLAEGEKEAASYEKFACFCKDTTAEKVEEIRKGTDDQTSLTTNIGALSTKRTQRDTRIQKCNTDIEVALGKMEKKTKVRKADLLLYEGNEADLSGALSGLQGAIEVLKSSAKPSLLQVQKTMEVVKNAQFLSEALGLSTVQSTRAFTSFLQGDQEPPMENYKFHSMGVIGTLEQLQKDFRTQKQVLDKAEVESVRVYDAWMQEKTDFVTATKQDMENTQKEKDEATAGIAASSQQLTTTSADLLDDKKYLAQTAEMCQNTAKTYKVRVKVRTDELSALTAATQIVKSTVSNSIGSASVRFVQMGVSATMAGQLVQNEDAMEMIEAEAEGVDKPMNFLQRAIRKHVTPIGEGAYQDPKAVMERTTDKRTKCEDGQWNDCYTAGGDYIDGHPSDRSVGLHQSQQDSGARDVVVNLLKTQGDKLKSTLLISLANQLTVDHFAKIKTLIQELIERLLAEAASEGNQKGWCDKATADANQKRDYAAEEIERLNGEMANLEATRNKLAEEITVLKKEILEIQQALRKYKKMRAEEKVENTATVSEAEIGLGAINQAIDILDKFYKTAAKSSVNLSLLQGPADDAPDAGFDIGEAYTGAGGESGGIIGMMDVIKSDFERTVKVTTEAEAKAQAENMKFKTESGMSLAEKEMANVQKQNQLGDAKEDLEAARASLRSEAALLSQGIKELMDLKPTCIDTGMSYEERVARREDEIESLKKAECVLSAYAKFGPEGVAGAC